MRRSAALIGYNLAEGAGRSLPANFARFVDIAAGSSNELEYQLRLARDLGYVHDAAHDNLKVNVERIRAMLVRLSSSLRSPHDA